MKAKKIAAWVLSGIVSLLIISSGVFKLIGSPELVEKLTQIGAGDVIAILGIMELVFAALFLFPKTIKIGFILTSCYFAGALATDLTHGGSIATPFVILSLVWIAAFLRQPEIFINTSKA